MAHHTHTNSTAVAVAALVLCCTLVCCGAQGVTNEDFDAECIGHPRARLCRAMPRARALLGMQVLEDVPPLPSKAELCAPYDDEAVQRVVYNRVYKTGSVSMGNTFISLAQRNRFQLVRSKQYSFWRSHNSWALRRRIARGVSRGHFSDKETFAVEYFGVQNKKRMMYDEHAAFMDFTAFDLDQPVYVNSIREPLERYASHYYYVRDNVQNSQRHLCPANKMQGTGLADCLNAVQAGNCTMTECSVTLYLTRFFCGNDGPCHDAESRASLREALFNIFYQYAAVGYLENLKDTWYVLEQRMPSWFAGGSNHVRARPANRHVPAGHSSRAVTSLSDDQYTILAKANANDVALYEATVFLLDRRAKACRSQH